MSPINGQNGTVRHWVVLREEPADRFTAQVIGLPELGATAATREEALQELRSKIAEWLALGKLVPVEVPFANPLLNFSGHLDPKDPLEQEFVEELARLRREDLERTLGEYDQECPDSSSTQTT